MEKAASFAIRIISAIALVFTPLTGTLSLDFLYVIVWIALVGVLIGALILWVILAGIAHLFARYVFRGQGSFVQLMKLYGYALAPASLVILSTVLLGISWVTWPFVQFLNVAAMFWIVLLMAVAVKHNYGLDIGKAFISSFIGPMVVQLVIMGIFWTWMWLYITSLAGGVI
jgi:hypothetical protein